MDAATVWMIVAGVLAYAAIGGTVAAFIPWGPYGGPGWQERAIIGCVWPIVPVVLLACMVLVLAKAGFDHIDSRKRGG